MNLNNLKIYWENPNDNLLLDVIKQSKYPSFSKSKFDTVEFNNMISYLESFVNWNYNTEDYWENWIVLIVANHPFWENILLNWNIYQKEYLYYLLNLCIDLSNLMDILWYYQTRMVKDSKEWIDFIHKPNLSNFIKLKDKIYSILLWNSKDKVDTVLW